ncbi:MAG: hypothetical protein QM503_13025 [Bacteroidota bacterium]
MNKFKYHVCFFIILEFVFSGIAYSAGEFKVYDSTLYKSSKNVRDKGIPMAFSIGIKTLETMYDGNIWPDSKELNDKPPEGDVFLKSIKNVKKSIGAFNIDVICLDIEHWSLKETNQKKLTENLNKYIKTIQLYKKKMPDKKFGYYSMLPVRNYYDALEISSSTKYLKWQNHNDKLVSLANNADIIFPSLYTFSSNKEDWVKYAVENIKQAKRYGKPVYVYIWPQYHPSVRFIGLNFMPADFWTLQLETALAHADGVVIWGGWDHDNNKQLYWDETAEWWQATKKFMKSITNE